jgi:hypothetical protein
MYKKLCYQFILPEENLDIKNFTVANKNFKIQLVLLKFC